MQSKPFRRVLVLAYYFPPMGLSGVQRVTKLVKYLPDLGWHPTILTVDPGAYFAFDESLMEDLSDERITIERTRTWDPTYWFGKKGERVQLPEESRRSLLTKLSQWIFIPDNKLGWYPFAVRKGKSLLDAYPFDAIYVSAPPYSSLLFALRLSNYAQLPFVCDFRDDWVGNPRHWYPTPFHRGLHAWLEKQILSKAAFISTINPAISTAIAERVDLENTSQVYTIPQGYDAEDFKHFPSETDLSVERDLDTCTFVYAGVFYDAQKPDDFLHGLATALRRFEIDREQISVQFVGLVPSYFDKLVASLELQDVVSYVGYVDHAVAIDYLLAADVLWMTIGERPGAETISTGKLFEYMGSLKPILALVPEGTAREALQPYGAATVVPPHDQPAISEAIRMLWKSWKYETLPKGNAQYAALFDRQHLAGQTAELLNRAATTTAQPRS